MKRSPKNSKPLRALSVRLTATTVEAIEAIASKEGGSSVTSVVQRALDLYVEKYREAARAFAEVFDDPLPLEGKLAAPGNAPEPGDVPPAIDGPAEDK
jgi:hypothetical protein